MYRVLFDYHPTELEKSKNCISLKEGDLVVRVKHLEKGWSVGFNRRTEETGVFPSEYVLEPDAPIVGVLYDIAGRYIGSKPEIPHEEPQKKHTQKAISEITKAIKADKKFVSKQGKQKGQPVTSVSLKPQIKVPLPLLNEHNDKNQEHVQKKVEKAVAIGSNETKNVEQTDHSTIKILLKDNIKDTLESQIALKQGQQTHGQIQDIPVPKKSAGNLLSKAAPVKIKKNQDIEKRPTSPPPPPPPAPPSETSKIVFPINDQKTNLVAPPSETSKIVFPINDQRTNLEAPPLQRSKLILPIHDQKTRLVDQGQGSVEHPVIELSLPTYQQATDHTYLDSVDIEKQDVSQETSSSPKSSPQKTQKLKKQKPKGTDKKYLKPVRGDPNSLKNRLIYSGRDEQTLLKSLFGLLAGLFAGAVLYVILVFSFSFSYESGAWWTLGITLILCFGLALSTFFRCIVMLTIPCIFTGRGRVAIFSAIFAILLAGPAVNIAYNAQEVSSSLGCVSELAYNQSQALRQQLEEPIREIARQILKTIQRLEVIAKTIEDALKPLQNALQSVQNAFDSAVKALQEASQKCISDINSAHDTCTSAINSAKSDCESALNSVTDTLSDAGSSVVGVVKDVIGIFGKRRKRHTDIRLEENRLLGMLDQEYGDAFKLSHAFPLVTNSNHIEDLRHQLVPIQRYRRFSLSSACDILDISSVCDVLNIASEICKIPGYVGDYAETAADATRTELNKFLNFFKFGVEGDLNVSADINSSKTASQILSQVEADITSRANWVTVVTAIISQVMAITILYIFIRSALYLRKFLTKDRYDNIYITSKFRKYDRARKKQGKPTALPLRMREKSKYIDVTSPWLSMSEVKSVKSSGMTVLYHVLITTLIILGDYGLYYLLIIINKYGQELLTAQGAARVNIRVTGLSLIAKFLKAFGDGIQLNDTYSVDFNITGCLPNPSAPGIGNLFIVSLLYIIALFFLVMQAYGLRLRNHIATYFYPEQEFDRIRFLHNQIRHRRATIFTWLKQYLPFRKKDQDISERITLSAMCFYRCPKLASMCGICHPKKDVECIVCGAQEDGLIQFFKCRASGCSGVYCKDCYKEARKNCLVCQGIDTFGSQEDISKS